MVEIIGTARVERRLSGLPLLDLSMGIRGNIGLPYCIYEVYGSPNTGKSTFVYFLSSILSREVGDIVVCDLEKLDTEYLQRAFTLAGFDGKVYLVPPVKEEKGKRVAMKHWEMAEEMLAKWRDPSVVSAVFDSVGAYVPMAVMEGTIEEANIGARARAISSLMRKSLAILQSSDTPKAMFVTNHVHQVISGYGTQTSGGVALSYISHVRINLRPSNDSIEDDETPGKRLNVFVVNGYVDKLRYGGRGGKFVFAIIPGVGVHPGLSLLFDLLEQKILERTRTIKYNGESIGYMADFVRAAIEFDNSKFELLFDIAKGWYDAFPSKSGSV